MPKKVRRVIKIVSGYLGKILRVNLSNLESGIEELREEKMRFFLGGINLGIKILYDEVPPGVDAFDPENRLIFVTAPMVGTLVPAANQYAIITKSPLTGFFGLGRAHGFFGPELKFAGFDAVVVYGRAEKLVYLWIHDGQAEVRDASSLSGKDTYEVEELICRELDDEKIRVACIGQAGENLSKMACVMNDRGHAAARCGVGAVMGSKRLKAIAVRGTGKVRIEDKAKILELRKEWYKISSENKNAITMSRYGTAGDYEKTEMRHAVGDLPTKNWTTALFPQWRNLSGECIQGKYPTKKNTCFNCHVGHDYFIKIPSGKYAGSYVYPEYEDTAAFGSNIGCSDTEIIIKLTDLANRCGVDSIEASHVISLAMECYEKGLLTKEDLEGIELTWGNGEATIQLLDKIVKREGIGNALAEGVKRAADQIGAPEFAICIKGMSPILHDLRHHWGWLISYTVAPGGPIHAGIGAGGVYTVDPDLDFPKLKAFSPQGMGYAAKQAHIKWLGLDVLGICVHAAIGVPLKLLIELLSAVTGWDITLKEFYTTIYRGVNLARAFNVRHGLTPADDWPSQRILEPPPDGPAEGVTAKKTLKAMLDDYYKQMGWDPKTGKPWRSTLMELGLDDVAVDLWGF